MTRHTFVIVRHGFSLANQSKTIVSDPTNGIKPEYGLTEEGKAQAAKSAAALREELLLGINPKFTDTKGKPKPVYVISSPFSRAVETANIFLEVLGRSSEPTPSAAAPSEKEGQNAKEKGAPSPAATAVTKPTAAANGASLRSRVLNVDLKPDISHSLCERNFGAYELQSDANYPKVWEEDLKSQHGNTKGVETLASVWARVSLLLNRLEHVLPEPSIILLVSHGDTLQITQTAFSGKPLTSHRSLKHLVQAEYRVLPDVPLTTSANPVNVFKSTPVLSKL